MEELNDWTAESFGINEEYVMLITMTGQDVRPSRGPDPQNELIAEFIDEMSMNLASRIMGELKGVIPVIHDVVRITKVDVPNADKSNTDKELVFFQFRGVELEEIANVISSMQILVDPRIMIQDEVEIGGITPLINTGKMVKNITIYAKTDWTGHLSMRCLIEEDDYHLGDDEEVTVIRKVREDVKRKRAIENKNL